jgi:hypothetical protein
VNQSRNKVGKKKAAADNMNTDGKKKQTNDSVPTNASDLYVCQGQTSKQNKWEK